MDDGVNARLVIIKVANGCIVQPFTPMPIINESAYVYQQPKDLASHILNWVEAQ